MKGTGKHLIWGKQMARTNVPTLENGCLDEKIKKKS